MKKLLIAACLLLAAAPAARADDDLDALYRAQMEADLKKLDFPCAENFGETPAEELVKTLEQYWDDLRNDKEVPDDAIACRVQALVKRRHAWSDHMILFSYMFSKDRPDYAVYFFTALERDRPHFADRMLAELYVRDGAQQDIPRATSMFRANAVRLLSPHDTPEECSENMLARRKKDNLPLHNAQIEWAAELCAKSENEIKDLAETFLQSGDVYGRIAADHIKSYIYWRWTIKEKTRQLEYELSKPI